MSRRQAPAPEPLFRWAHQREAWLRRRRRRTRRTLALSALGCSLLLGSALFPPHPRLVWNLSQSAPAGLYLVRPGAVPARGATVIARLPRPFRALAAQRGYLPANVPLVKRVEAAASDSVCALGPAIFVNGKRIAMRRMLDAQGRAMPHWQGCVRLRAGEFLLLMPHPDSFDGRYFGVSGAADLIGPAQRLWAR
ncbi:MAG TPA: S26 family signal peptidase [Sphingomonas sp.]|nr:S26 family signal peptidase [Sphingomonas sp.]